jgi:ribosomal protein S18 acetylase RimI-like enzyme
MIILNWIVPSADDYLELNRSVGWGKVPYRPSIEKALQNSLLCLCVFQHDKVLGFARVVGDRSICFYIQDLIIHPEYQQRGIGSSLMSSAMEFIKKNAAPKAFVGLMAAVDTEPFYEKFGFKRRPDGRPGMDMLVR